MHPHHQPGPGLPARHQCNLAPFPPARDASWRRHAVHLPCPGFAASSGLEAEGGTFRQAKSRQPQIKAKSNDPQIKAKLNDPQIKAKSNDPQIEANKKRLDCSTS
jgi:hypothetical protein